MKICEYLVIHAWKLFRADEVQNIQETVTHQAKPFADETRWNLRDQTNIFFYGKTKTELLDLIIDALLNFLTLRNKRK